MQDKETNKVNDTEMIPFDFLIKQYDIIRREIWFTRIKTLLELLVTSCALFVSLFFWRQLLYHYLPMFKYISIIIIVLINISSWFFWVVRISPFGRIIRRTHRPDIPYGIDVREMFEQMKFHEYVYNRCKATERAIDITTALQFVYMIIIWVLVIVIQI